MSSETRYHCKNPQRVAEVRDRKTLNGIEYLEVDSPDQMTLKVYFVLPLPKSGAPNEVPQGGVQLKKENLRIEGGVRIKNLHVASVQTQDNVLTIVSSAAGDFSPYQLRLVASDIDNTVPAGFDPRLSSIEFSFKAGCPTDFDCKADETCPPESGVSPTINYLAKDYVSFRRLMLDRLSVLMPEWRDRSPADPLVTLVESLAYTADQMSYWQDAVATEAYLGTARKRVSLRRHARLLDYRMHDGCAARTWIHLNYQKAANAVLPAGTPVLTRGEKGTIVFTQNSEFQDALREGSTAFETLHDLTLDAAHNQLEFYTWSDTECCLEAGATRATFLNDPPVTLKSGDWLLLEELRGATTGLEADADSSRRQIVRIRKIVPGTDPLNNTSIVEIEWDSADALTMEFNLTRVIDNGRKSLSVARGNLALVEHGRAISGEILTLDPVAPERTPRATLASGNLSFGNPFDPAVFAQEGKEQTLPVEKRQLHTFFDCGGRAAIAPGGVCSQDLFTIRKRHLAAAP